MNRNIKYIFIFTHALYFIHVVSTDGKLTYSKVTTFLKKWPSMITTYKSITTLRNKTISLSGNHLIYARKDGNDKFNPA